MIDQEEGAEGGWLLSQEIEITHKQTQRNIMSNLAMNI